MAETPIEGVREAVRLGSGAGSGEAVAERVLERLARAGTFRDEETAEHVERMSRSCALIASELGWGAPDSGVLRTAAAMHDIGKVGVPDAILRKPERLTPAERPLVEAHTTIGYDILRGSGDPVLDLAAEVALTHHERFDGGGYPGRLAGEDIPLAGRIAAIADVFDALTHDRVYRSAFSVEESVEMLRRGRGGDFDPTVLDAFERVLPEIEQVRALYPDPGPAPNGGRRTSRRGSSTGRSLTAREREVVTLLALGMSGEQIAARLFLSSETVKTHIRNAMQRLGAKTRAHLVARAITTGEIASSPPRSPA